MKKNNKIKWSLTGVLILLVTGGVFSQSYTELNTAMTVFGGTGATEMGRTLYIGPNANINVIGEWRIASEQIFISPSAVIGGTGTIIFDQPSKYSRGAVPLVWTAQTVDGGGATISCRVLIRNGAGVSLNHVIVPAAIGYADDTISDVRFDKELAFAGTYADGSTITGNDLVLNNGRSVFTINGTVTNYNPDHFIVTNGTGTCAKDAIGATGFTFPVGIATADYTPARIVNNGTADRYDVRVLQGIVPPFAGSTASVDRTWAITEAVAGGSDVQLTLQHNYTTGYGGPGTSGPDYDNNDAFVSQSQEATPTWDTYLGVAGTTPGSLTTGSPIANATTLTRSSLTDFVQNTMYSKFSPIVFASLKGVKTVTPDSIYLGDIFTYHIKVVNNGPITQIEPVIVRDTLPSGASLISTDGSGWAITSVGNIITAIYADSISIGDSSKTFDIVVRGVTDALKNLAYIGQNRGPIVPSAPCDTCTPGLPTFPIVKVPHLIIPDGFSPNGDGNNDVFVVVDLEHAYPMATLGIFNRWGDEVWYSNGPYRNDFDGHGKNGEALPDGTYFYTLDFNDGTGRKQSHFLDLSR